MNKDSKLLSEAYEDSVLGRLSPAASLQQLKQFRKDIGEDDEEEITLQDLFDYNNDFDIEDVWDKVYKGVRSGQISYDTYSAFMRTFTQ